MPSGSNSVFLSYASEDADAAQRICQALRSAGIEVWFDQSELRGGDVWDQTIRRQIKACILFIPVLSRHTHGRDEGYFRLEWKLAVDRSNLMASNRAFLLPVVIDDTGGDDENVPDRFKDIHWTRLPAGETSPSFVERVQRLVSPESSEAPASSHVTEAPAVSLLQRDRGRKSRWGLLASVLVLIAVAAHFTFHRVSASNPAVSTPAASAAPSAAAPAPFAPPPHSIAVLPFVNLSGDPGQEYFSDGLTEELLNSLAEINDLQVAARTSAFSFKGKDVKIGTIAHELNVASVLEGSVRRSGKTLRITAQLVNAQSGYRMWSKTFDRDMSDVLKLQTEIATSVAEALKVTLLGEVGAKIELGGTHTPAAFDAYLRGRKASQHGKAQSYLDAIAAYTEAIRLDPNYALAIAARSLAYTSYAAEFATGVAVRENHEMALDDAHHALALAPELPEGLLALAHYCDYALAFGQARDAYERARTLAPGNALVLLWSGRFAVWMGQTDPGLAALRRAVVLDPLNPRSHSSLSLGLYYARRYAEAVAAASEALSMDPEFRQAYGIRGLAYYGLGETEHARASCEGEPDYWISQQCLAVTYEKLSRHGDAQAVVDKLKAAMGDAPAYQYATIYAQWGDRAKALEWLDIALRLRDSGLVNLKTDPLMDQLREEPRFEKVMRELKFAG